MSPLTIVHCTHTRAPVLSIEPWMNTLSSCTETENKTLKTEPPPPPLHFKFVPYSIGHEKWSLNPSCSGQKWPQLANNPSPFKPHSQPTWQHRAASASGLDSRRTFTLIHIFPRLPFSFSSSLHCVLKSHCLHYLKLCSMLRSSAEKRECTGLERWIENCT